MAAGYNEEERGAAARYLLVDLPMEVTEEDLAMEFGKYGELLEVVLKHNPTTGEPRASVKFDNPTLELRGHMLNRTHKIQGKPVTVQTWKMQKLQRPGYKASIKGEGKFDNGKGGAGPLQQPGWPMQNSMAAGKGGKGCMMQRHGPYAGDDWSGCGGGWGGGCGGGCGPIGGRLMGGAGPKGGCIGPKGGCAGPMGGRAGPMGGGCAGPMGGRAGPMGGCASPKGGGCVGPKGGGCVGPKGGWGPARSGADWGCGGCGGCGGCAGGGGGAYVSGPYGGKGKGWNGGGDAVPPWASGVRTGSTQVSGWGKAKAPIGKGVQAPQPVQQAQPPAGGWQDKDKEVTARYLLTDLPPECAEEELTDYFSTFAAIEEVTLKAFGEAGGQSGSVKFIDPTMELRNLMLKESHEIRGKKITVQTWKMRKLQRPSYQQKVASQKGGKGGKDSMDYYTSVDVSGW